MHAPPASCANCASFSAPFAIDSPFAVTVDLAFDSTVPFAVTVDLAFDVIVPFAFVVLVPRFAGAFLRVTGMDRSYIVVERC